MGKYQVDITLTRLAAIAISKELWKHSYLKRSVKECIDEDGEPEYMLPPDITYMMTEFAVPEPAKQELMFVVGMMGHDIWEFFSELHMAYHGILRTSAKESVFTPEASIWVDYIRWTKHGCVDFYESMRSLYMSNILPESLSTWMELCAHSLEDCIHDFYPKLLGLGLDQPRDWINQLLFRGNFEFDMMLSTYWMVRVRNGPGAMDDDFRQELPEDLYDDDYSVEENIFIYAFVSRKDFAVEYFWGLLGEDQRTRTIATICEKILSDDPTTQQFKDLFFSEDALAVHMTVFFLQQLCNYGHEAVRIKILGSGFILRELLEWPYDNLFLKTLEESWIHHDSIDYGPIISRLFHMLCYCKRNQFIERDFKYRRIFSEIWEKNPKNLKTSICYYGILSMLWDKEEINLLNDILKDEELAGRRKELLEGILETYNPDKTSDVFLEKFIKQVLNSEEERDWFRGEIALNSPMHY